ncbi:MAG TPA: hypothetical protein VF939_27545 [Puia sp.]
MRISSFDRIPFRIYATAFSDGGYAYNENFYAGFDYSFNQLGQNGLFLHIRNDF